MIFSLVSSAQEWLNVKWDVSKKEEETRVLQKQKELEEVERVSGCFCTHTHTNKLTDIFINFMRKKNFTTFQLKNHKI